MKKITLLIVIFILFGSLGQAQEKVFYSSFRPQGWDIYFSNDHGENFSKFTEHESLDYDAKIAPDGEWVVFTSERNGRPQLFIKSTTTNDLPRLLVKSSSMQDQVDFSPDGEWIVFVSTHGGNADIYKLPFAPSDTLDINEAVNLTKDKGGDFRPKFSNDGKKIAFSSDRAHETKPLRRIIFAMQRTGDIYVMNADGSETKRMTNSENWEGSPVWTRDDSALIYYYAAQEQPYKLFKMSANGSNAEQISSDSYSAVSPVVKSANQVLFSSMDRDSRRFSLVELNTATKQVDSTYVRYMDMFNADYHPSGIMVYHGGKRPEKEPTNINDFTGSLLVKNQPQVVADLPNHTLSLFGVRRSFAAPPTHDGKIVYAVSSANSFQEAVTPYMYPIFLLLALALFWLIFGIFRSIKKRKTIAFWKHLIFSVVAVLIVIFIIKSVDNKLSFDMLPLNEIKQFLLLVFTVLLVLASIAYFFYLKRKRTNKPIASLYKLYALMFVPYAVLLLYAGLFFSSFFNTEQGFYTVDYTTNEIHHLLNFVPDGDFNPQFANIIDTKITPDGQYLQFSVGGFRKSPKAKGGVYRYHLENKSIELLTDLNSNNGFADFSEDNEVMVFRSGRTGNMDIYVQENDNTINITNSPDRENFPVISHDGNKIAYSSDVSGVDKDGIIKTVDIYITERVDDKWSTPKQLTSYSGQEGHPHFSPDGEWLIYATEEFGINDEQPLIQPYIFSPQMYGEITAIRLADGEKFRLTHNKWEDGAPLWIKGD